MNYWLMKSEPDVFSIDDLAQKGTAGWDGVRNYQARNFMRSMQLGDSVFFYHSSTQNPAIVGVMSVVSSSYPDPTQFEAAGGAFDPASKKESPRWSQIDVEFVRKFKSPVSLERIKSIPELQNMVLVRNSRLSVQPVQPLEWKKILSMAAFLIMLGAGMPVLAACTYFRTGFRVESCAASTVAPAPSYDTGQDADPLHATVDNDKGDRVLLVCACEYSLSGADPRCDVDREMERQAFINQSDVKAVCREAKKRCKEICVTPISDGESR